jgi:two-component system, NarL family, nitrate/nitrite response regulator NarL
MGAGVSAGVEAGMDVGIEVGVEPGVDGGREAGREAGGKAGGKAGVETGIVRVLVADDHPIVLDGVTLALQNTSWLMVVGYARSGREAVAAAETLRPDVLLLDLRLPDMLGPEAVQALRVRAPDVKIILFTAYPDHAALDASLAAGAHGVVVKDTEQEDLVDAIRRVIAGERVTYADTGDSGGAMLNRKLRDHGLTRREYDILRRVAMGETNPEIAAALGLTRNTVKTYLQRALEKLGARNRVEALSRASEIGIL